MGFCFKKKISHLLNTSIKMGCKQLMHSSPFTGVYATNDEKLFARFLPNTYRLDSIYQYKMMIIDVFC